jgi:hypothetical protein
MKLSRTKTVKYHHLGLKAIVRRRADKSFDWILRSPILKQGQDKRKKCFASSMKLII